jgi:hypothetical protein
VVRCIRDLRCVSHRACIMKIAYLPQPSMRSYADNRWLLSASMQIHRMVNNVKALPDDWKWLLLVPKPGLREGRPWQVASNIDVWSMDWASNVLQSRYHLDYLELHKMIATYKPDIMITEQPEHARAIRMAQAATGVDFPIVSFWTHVDINRANVHSDTDPILRQIDGFMASDEVAFQSPEEMTTWFTGAEKLLSGSLDRSKASVWNGIFDPAELDSVKQDKLPSKNPLIYFVSRLSDNPRTRWEEFAEATHRLAKRNLVFDVAVANPNEALTDDEIGKRFANVVKIGTTGREDYLRTLWGSDIVPILYSNGSVSFCEAASSNNMILTSCNRAGAKASGMLTIKQNPDASSITMALETAIRIMGNDSTPERLNGIRTSTLQRHGTAENIHQVQDSIDVAFARHRHRRVLAPLKTVAMR